MRRISSIAAIVDSALLPATAHACSALYLFRDSLSDVGNVYLATGGGQPAAPYFDGHYSSGGIWVEDLSNSLGLGPVAASLAGGNDYAYGGAATGYSAPPSCRR